MVTEEEVYYVTFNTVNGYPGSINPISPLVQALKDIPAGQPLAPETGHQSSKIILLKMIPIGLKSLLTAPIGTIYNYVPGTNKAAVNDEGIEFTSLTTMKPLPTLMSIQSSSINGLLIKN